MNKLSIPTLIVASVALLLFCLPAGAMTVLGTGAGALIGGDLTDPENDGAADADVNYNATFTSDNEPAFGGGEFSFNVFDNRTGGGSDKWCCDDASPGNILYGPGHQLTAQLDGGQAVLSQFTMTSSNDSAPRDPVVWGIQGSNDGTNFTTIYAQNGSVWSARRQVVLFEAGIDYNMPAPYEYFRYSVTETAGGSQHALGEIEYIGTLGTAAEIGGDNTIGSLAQSGILENEMPVAAELIRITQNKPTGSNPLMLAEVQAFQTGTGTNVALAGTATQSSQLGGFAPGLAIDDDLGNFTHTNDGFGQWWEVDLAAPTDLDSVTIFSRVGCCSQGRTSDLIFQVFGDAAGTDLLYEENVLGIGTSDSRNIPLVYADLRATLESELDYTFELLNSSSYDQLYVPDPNPLLNTTILDFDGASVSVEFLGGFTVVMGDVFQLFDADMFTGEIGGLSLPMPPEGLEWKADFLQTQGVLLAVPEPATLTLCGLGLAALARRRRRSCR